MPWFKKTFIAFLFFLIFDLIFTFFFYDKQNEISIKHEIFHHHFLSNYSYERKVGRFGKYRIITNSLGFRDSSIKQIDFKKKNRIVFIGDSFIEGVLLDYQHTVPGLANEYFSKKNIEVLNAGVSSYSPIIYYNKIKYYLEKGLEFSHLVVFIDISDIQDESLWYNYDDSTNSVKSSKFLINIENKKKNSLRTKISTFLKNNLIINYEIFYFLNYNLVARYLSPKEEKFIENLVSKEHDRDKWTIYDDVRIKYNDGIQNSIKNMQLLKNILDEYKIKLTIVVYPWISQIYYKDLNSIQVKIWEEFSKKNNVKFINLFPVFINNKINKVNIYEIIKEDFIQYDVHWNRNGSKKIFDYFIKKFEY